MMEQLQTGKNFEKINLPYNLESLMNLNWEITDEVDEAEEEVYEMKERGDIFKKKLSETRSAVAKKYIEKLKAETDRFRYIFETEKGSTYFITQNGESLRFKNTEKGISCQPVMLKTFFIDQLMLDEIKEVCKNSGDICDFSKKNDIRVSDLQIGVYPLELDSATAPGHGNVVYAEKGNTLKVKGTKVDSGYVDSSGFLYHLGHKVTKIIK